MAYDKDLWAQMPGHVEVFVGKDASAGTVQPVTRLLIQMSDFDPI